MSKFVVVKEAPKELQKGDYLIDKPSFVEQIALHKAKKPRNGLTATHYLRIIIDSIAEAYDPSNMNGYSIKAHKYEGITIGTDEQLDNIIINALQQDYPSVFSKYLEKKIRSRPSGTQRVIYVDSNIPGQYELFYQNGLSEEKAESTQKAKSDKVVGKPAITKEEAEAKKNQVDTE